MAKVFLICGKICCGKSYYANQLKETEKAIILSSDEITAALFNNDLGDKHDEMTKKIKSYLLKKAAELVKVGCNVILDWGFWTKGERDFIKSYFKEKNIVTEFHYIDIDDKTWQKNIQERNKRVMDGNGGSDFYLDEGLKNKLLLLWEEPNSEEIDVWFKLKR